MKSYKQRVVRIPVGVHKLPKVDFQQDISVRNNAASQISYQSYLIVDSQSNRLRNTESGIPYYLITQVSDLDFRQFVHMPVVLSASCCSR